MDTLSALLARIETCFGFQICVHDVSGITHAHEQLSLEGRHTYHDCSYCATLKQNPKCQNRCLQQKRLALREARRKPEGYLGVCYLGVCEAVRTVSLAGRPVAVVFVGGVVKELGAQARERAIRNSALLGGSMDVGTLFDAFAQQAQTSRDTLCF
ncbi:MAG: PocR ligand-binding domain-containing protein, partial [Clostridia bacterium]